MSKKLQQLRTVVKVKSHQEKKAQRELAEIQEKQHEENGRLESLHRTTEDALQETSAILKARATELQTSHAFLQSLARQIQRQHKKLEAIRQLEENKKEELLQRKQSREMIDRLVEKRLVHENKERERKEQRILDVLAHRIRWGF
jgi:flagellar export protein FliJ